MRKELTTGTETLRNHEFSAFLCVFVSLESVAKGGESFTDALFLATLGHEGEQAPFLQGR
jgi:hypothetical protein